MAFSGKDALDIISARPKQHLPFPDYIFVDLNMPVRLWVHPKFSLAASPGKGKHNDRRSHVVK